MNPPETSNPGVEKLGPYRLLRQLGEGGMARIYLAEHERLGRICAIKRLHADHFEDRVTVARFLGEARAVSDIAHPNLVQVYDVVEQPDEIYLVMEYLDGLDVAQVLRDEVKLDPLRAAEIAAQACDGLSPVHARQIIHRDLKPENIFLAREPGGRERVKLLDFGVARLNDDRPREALTRSGLTVGTPTYMSPEQATASPIDGRSDLYGIGVLLYEMICGQPPFVGSGYGDVMLMHVNQPPPLLSTRRSDVPPWLEAVVMRCLEKEPEARYQTADDLAAALRDGPSRSIELPARAERPEARSRRWMAVAGGVALAAIAGVVAIAHTTREETTVIAPLAPAPPKVSLGTPPYGATPSTKVQVVVQPAGARVRLDGAEVCRAPCAVPLPRLNDPFAMGSARAHRSTVSLEVAADGFVVEARRIDLLAPPAELRFALHPRAVGDARPPAPTARRRPVSRDGTVDPFGETR